MVSASLAIFDPQGESRASSGPLDELKMHGWLETEALPCPEASAGRYYELEGESESVEAYSSSPSLALVARLPLPEKILKCREIPSPHFIQEIE